MLNCQKGQMPKGQKFWHLILPKNLYKKCQMPKSQKGQSAIIIINPGYFNYIIIIRVKND